MNDYCKRNPLDPSCGINSKRYELDYRKSYSEDAPHRGLYPPTARRKGVRELSMPERRKGVIEYEPPTRRKGVVELNTVRRKGVREVKDQTDPTLLTTYGGTHIRPSVPRAPPLELEPLRKNYNKRLKLVKERGAELFELGQHEVIEPRGQHKYGHMTEAAYKAAYKNNKAALKQLKEGGKYIPELNDFEIVPEFSDYDYLALENRTTGELVQAGRGSDTEFFKADKNIEAALRGRPLTQRLKKGVNDWFVNSKFFLKQHLDTTTYINQERDLLGFANSRGVEPKSIKLAGHSKAGATAEFLARKYGNEAHIFNPATHPTSELIPNDQVHPDAEINVYGEEFDIVSAARNYKKTPKFMKVHRYTTTPGTELDTLGRHDHSLAIPKPSRVVNGEIMAVRNTKLRNRMAFVGGSAKDVGVAGLKAGLLALPAMAFQPQYETKSERTYRNRVEMPIDLAKGVLEYEGVSALGISGAKGIGRFTQGLAPGAAIGAYTDLLMLDQQDNIYLHKGLAKIRHKIFGKDAPKEEAKPPEFITWFNKNFSPERYNEDQEYAYERSVYDNDYDGDLSWDNYIARYGDAKGYYHNKAVEMFGYDPSEAHQLSTEEMRQAEALYDQQQAEREQLEQDPYIRHYLEDRNGQTFTVNPTFNYEAAAAEDRRRTKEFLQYAQDEGAVSADVGRGSSLLAFDREDAEAEGRMNN